MTTRISLPVPPRKASGDDNRSVVSGEWPTMSTRIHEQFLEAWFKTAIP